MRMPINIRTLRTRSLLNPFTFSTHFSTPSSINFLNLQNLSSVGYKFTNPSPASHAIVNSFKDWFKTAQNPLLERVFQILRDEGKEDRSYSTSVDVGLSQLGLKLSDSFIRKVLDYGKDDVLSCLKFFDWAGRQPGFKHSHATSIAVFKILSRAKLTSLMVDLLNTYFRDNHLHKVRLNDILVIGYSLAGKVEIALQVFGKTRFNGMDLDESAYHVLVNALVEEGRFDAVSVVLGQIRMLGHEKEVTHNISMKSLCKQGKLDEAEEYLRGLLGRDQVVSGNTLGVLVHALCKKGMFLHAGKLIHEFWEMGVVPMREAYSVWITDLVQVGKIDGAMEFFQTKKSLEGYIPEVFRYNFLMHRLLRENRLEEVSDLLMEMKENRIVPDKVTMNVALAFFCKAGVTHVALELYEMKSEFGFTPNSLVYNYLVNNLIGDGSTDEAYRVLKNSMKHGFFPGQRTFYILADALCREGKLDKMKNLILFALESKFMPATSTYEKFIKALCRARMVEDGYLIHGELSRLNKEIGETTYSHLIHGFKNAGRGDIAAKLLIDMQEKGHKPPRKLYRAAILCLCEMESPEKNFLQLLEMQLSHFGPKQPVFNLFIDAAGHAKCPELAREVYEMMKRTGTGPNLSSDILMLQSYLRNERIADALNFFDDVSKRRKVGKKFHNAMVVGLCKVGKAEFALAMLNQARNEGLVPSLECYEALVKLYCSEKKYDEAIKLVDDMEKAGRRISSFIGNALLFHSMQSIDLYKAWVRSREVSNETPSTSMLGQLIAAFSGFMRVNTSVEDLETVVQECFPLDLYSYNLLLRKLSVDQIDGAIELFERLCQIGYEPNRWTYDILVNGLYKHGRITEAKMWAEEMLRKGHFPAKRVGQLMYRKVARSNTI